MTRVLTEEELAARDAIARRMQAEQSQRDDLVKQGRVQEDVERCAHGIPLRKSCPKCDVVTDDQIQDRVHLGTVGG